MKERDKGDNELSKLFKTSAKIPSSTRSLSDSLARLIPPSKHSLSDSLARLIPPSKNSPALASPIIRLNEQARANALRSLLSEGRKNIEKVKRQVFYSFHFDNDVMRVQQVRNIGAIEDNKPVSANDWETIKNKGSKAIEKWIDDNMKYRTCVVVLVGEKTAERPWVQYEIHKAWKDKKGLLGIYIHNINCPKKKRETGNGTCNKGPNPFDRFTFTDGPKKGEKLSTAVKCFNPNPTDAYNIIKNNIEDWIEKAIESRKS